MSEEPEGVFLESLGLHFIVERHGDRIRRTSFSQEKPDRPLPAGWKEALLRCWLEGDELPFELDLSSLTAFQREVLEVATTIPPGETLTYGEVAERLDRPGAARAVGRALSTNPFPLIIPCHRVVAKSGIGGYSFGQDLKRRLLELEKRAGEEEDQSEGCAVWRSAIRRLT